MANVTADDIYDVVDSISIDNRRMKSRVYLRLRPSVHYGQWSRVMKIYVMANTVLLTLRRSVLRLWRELPTFEMRISKSKDEVER